MLVADLMTRDVASVTPGTSLKEVAALLVERRISGLPVCDASGTVLGVVSEADILWKTQGYPPERSRFLHWFVDQTGGDDVRLHARDAGSAMTAPAVTICSDTDAARAARLMVENRVNRLPVVDGGRLVGILTRADLVRAFTRVDEEIETEIRETVLLHTMWIDPSRVEITVEDGDVTLIGQVENRTGAELVESYVRRVPGVVSVSCQLTWAHDDRGRHVAHSL
jgi:CBS domain-containing protein